MRYSVYVESIRGIVYCGLEKGKYLMPGTPLAGECTPEEIRRIAATLN